MIAKHTPGPWTVRYFDPWDKDIKIDPCLVTVDHDDVDHEEAQANARLIAAAPELSAFAEHVLSWIGTLRKVSRDRFLPGMEALERNATEVLAKARGEVA